MTNLETKELRGITLKLVWTVLGSAAACIGVGVRMYFGVITTIQESKSNYEIHEFRIRTLETQTAKNTNDIELFKYKFKASPIVSQ